MDSGRLVTSHGGIVDKDIRRVLLTCLEVLKRREAMIVKDLDAGMDEDAITDRGHIYGDFSRFLPPHIWDLLVNHGRLRYDGPALLGGRLAQAWGRGGLPVLCLVAGP